MKEIIINLCILSAEIASFYDDLAENLSISEQDYAKFSKLVSKMIYTKTLIEKTFGYGRFYE